MIDTKYEYEIKEPKVKELFLIIVNDLEYLFHIDKQHKFNLREDEYLSTLSTHDIVDISKVVEHEEEP